MFLIPSKLTEESWLVAVKNTPQKQHDFGLSSRSVRYYSRIQKELAALGIELSISITVLKSERDLFDMEHSAKHSYCSIQSASHPSTASFFQKEAILAKKERKGKLLSKYLRWDWGSSTSIHRKMAQPAQQAFPLTVLQGMIESEFPGSSTPPALWDMKGRLLRAASVTAICHACFYSDGKFCVKGRDILANTKGDFWGVILIHWGTGHTKFYTALHTISWVHRTSSEIRRFMC